MRRGRNGDYHWVSPHDVTRGKSRKQSFGGPHAPTKPAKSWTVPEYPRTESPSRVKTSPRRGLDRPNATCPRCNKPVWFIRNQNGGCAYFDEIGWPWPKHPCMVSSPLFDHGFAARLAVEYEEAQRRGDVRSWLWGQGGPNKSYSAPGAVAQTQSARAHPRHDQFVTRTPNQPVSIAWRQAPASRQSTLTTPEVVFTWCFVSVVLGIVIFFLLLFASAP